MSLLCCPDFRHSPSKKLAWKLFQLLPPPPFSPQVAILEEFWSPVVLSFLCLQNAFTFFLQHICFKLVSDHY